MPDHTSCISCISSDLKTHKFLCFTHEHLYLPYLPLSVSHSLALRVSPSHSHTRYTHVHTRFKQKRVSAAQTGAVGSTSTVGAQLRCMASLRSAVRPLSTSPMPP